MSSEQLDQKWGESLLWVLVHSVCIVPDQEPPRHDILKAHWQAAGLDVENLNSGIAHAMGRGWLMTMNEVGLVVPSRYGDKLVLSEMGYDDAPDELPQ